MEEIAENSSDGLRARKYFLVNLFSCRFVEYHNKFSQRKCENVCVYIGFLLIIEMSK